jgi:hypothetical protein
MHKVPGGVQGPRSLLMLFQHWMRSVTMWMMTLWLAY